METVEYLPVLVASIVPLLVPENGSFHEETSL